MASIVTLDKHFQNGLRADWRLSKGSAALERSRGLVAMPYGLRELELPEVAFTDSMLQNGSVTKAWPFPQLLRGGQSMLLCGETKIFESQPGYDFDTELEFYAPSDYRALSTPLGIIPGTGWHMADFFTTWALFNGECVILKTAHLSGDPAVNAPVPMLSSGVTINTGCDSNEGRFIMAGFNPSDFYSVADWPTFFADYRTQIPDEIKNMGLDNGAGQNWVWWSTIGGGDMLWLHSLDACLYGFIPVAGQTDGFGKYGPDNPWIFGLWRRNQAGMRPMPFQGLVQRVLPFFNGNVGVYGSDGSAALVNVGAPVASMMTREIVGMGSYTGVGENARCAVGGDGYGHLLLDAEGDLWHVTPDLQAQFIGGKEYFADWNRTNVVVTKDSKTGQYWLSDGTEHFVVREGRISEVNVACSSVVSRAGTIQAIQFPEIDTDYDCVTHPMEGPNCGIMMIGASKLSGEWTDASTPSVSIYYKLRADDDWSETEPVEVSRTGEVIHNVTCTDWKFHITAQTTVGLSIDRIVFSLFEYGETKRSLGTWLAEHSI